MVKGKSPDDIRALFGITNDSMVDEEADTQK